MYLERVCVTAVPTRLENPCRNAIRLSECFAVDLDPVAILTDLIPRSLEYHINTVSIILLFPGTVVLVHFSVDHLVMLTGLASL